MSNIKDLQIGQGVELDLVFTQAPIAMAFFEGPEMVIKSANPMMLDLWGKDAGIIGLELLQALPELEGQPFPELLGQVYLTGIEYKGYETLARIERKGILEDCYFNFIYSPLRDPLGNVIGVCAVATEVTEQVVAKMQLQASERRFKQFIFNADVATGFYTGRDMVIQVANDAMLQVWGKDASVIGKPLAEALPELQGQPFLDLLDRVYTTGETYKANADAVDLVVDGELQTFYYNFSYKALFDANGEVYGILNMAINVTEQELANRRLAQSEMALLASEKNLQDLADSMPQI
ncbi:MAG TPA: PAS domain-containing protein, partial [Sphingobacteriaceae bacterium]